MTLTDVRCPDCEKYYVFQRQSSDCPHHTKDSIMSKKNYTPGQFLQRELAEKEGFAIFNDGPHLCLNIPDGPFTISCRTSEGRKITFAFCPYQKDGPAQCVDIQNHDTNAVKVNGDTDCPIQQVICFTTGERHVPVEVRRPCSHDTHNCVAGPLRDPDPKVIES